MKTLVAFALSVALASFTAQAALPHLSKQGSTQQLIVGGKPYLILGGELGNSSASSAEYMRAHWPRLKSMNLNTVYSRLRSARERLVAFLSVEGGGRHG